MATLQHSYSSACLIGHAVVNAIADAEDAFSWNSGWNLRSQEHGADKPSRVCIQMCPKKCCTCCAYIVPGQAGGGS